MCEVPVRMLRRGGGVSSIGSGKSFYYMVKVLLAVFVALFRTRPDAAERAEGVDQTAGEPAVRSEDASPVVAERPT